MNKIKKIIDKKNKSTIVCLTAYSKPIAKILDNKGSHTRAAISSNSLPLGVAVEVDAIFEIN